MSKPRLDETMMAQELGAVASFAQSQPPSPQPPSTPVQTPRSSESQPPHSPIHQSSSQTTGRSTERPSGKLVGRPKAFYITVRLNQRLDEAVRYYQAVHGLSKVDRSTIINAMLDNGALWTDEALDAQIDRVISQLTSRLTG